MIEIDIVRLILAPESLSILLYYFIPGYLFFTFIKFKEFYGLTEKWKMFSGLDIILFSIIISLIFSLTFVIIFYAFIDWTVGVISALGILAIQLPIHYFEKYNLFKVEYLFIFMMDVTITYFSEISFTAVPFSFFRLMAPTIGLVFFLLTFKILRFKLFDIIKPGSDNKKRFL